MNGGTDDEGELPYGMATVEPEPAEIEHKPHESGHVVTVLVYSGAAGLYSAIPLSPILNIVYRPQYASHDSYGWRNSAGRHNGVCLTMTHHG